MPYTVIGGRSNARWWLLPLGNRHVTTSGLALFQPINASAQRLKLGAVVLSQLGLIGLWAKPMVYIKGEPPIAKFFGSQPLSYAFFTGTDCPHRKIAVQVMNYRGRIEGYAKLTRSPQVRELLLHEAATLKKVNSLGLQTAHVPKVLFAGDLDNSTLLVTDTLKTARTPTTRRFTAAHRALIQELAQKTAEVQPVHVVDIAKDFRARYGRIRPQLETKWRRLLNNAISKLETQPTLKMNASLSHGDFTPWNTFVEGDRLYVFDWEYAEQARPVGTDIIHFVMNQQHTRNLTAQAKIEAASATLLQTWTGVQSEAIPALLVIYLLTQSLRQIERLPSGFIRSDTWDGAEQTAAMLNSVCSLES